MLIDLINDYNNRKIVCINGFSYRLLVCNSFYENCLYNVFMRIVCIMVFMRIVCIMVFHTNF